MVNLLPVQLFDVQPSVTRLIDAKAVVDIKAEIADDVQIGPLPTFFKQGFQHDLVTWTNSTFESGFIDTGQEIGHPMPQFIW
jgi:acyl-[acyl carrier protein]--UDP-N-acetylglucosamine O-acyltransferase